MPDPRSGRATGGEHNRRAGRRSTRANRRPGPGGLRLREGTVGWLDRFLRQLASSRPGAARGAKCVLGQMFALAVRYDVVQSNPVRDTGRLSKHRRPVRALTLEEDT